MRLMPSECKIFQNSSTFSLIDWTFENLTELNFYENQNFTENMKFESSKLIATFIAILNIEKLKKIIFK